MNRRLLSLFLAAAGGLAASAADVASGVLAYEPAAGAARGKHIVLLAGDEEYRSEEVIPQLAKILAQRHGFRCTALLPVNPQTGFIDPPNGKTLPGAEALDSADAIVMLLRFRQWDDAAMAKFDAALKRGVPVVAMRTSTHAFNFDAKSASAYKHYSFNSRERWPGGFGKQVLGETWVSHWGHHKFEATRGVVEAGAEKHPILRGVSEVFGDTDVYEARPPADAVILLRGQVLKGMKPDDPALEGPKNSPMMPVAWTRNYTNEAGTVNRIFCTTMGAASDFTNEGFRRMVVNAVYWGAGLESAIPEKADVALVGDFQAIPYGFGTFRTNIKPEAHQ